MRSIQHFLFFVLFSPLIVFGQSITITPESKTVGIGDTISVNIDLSGFSGNLATAQGTLEWDPDILFFDASLTDALSNFGLPQMTSSDFGLTDVLFGRLNCGWSYSGNNPPAYNPIWFTIKFIVVGNVGTSTTIELTDGPAIGGTPMEFTFLNEIVPNVFIPVALGINSVGGTITVAGTGFPVTWLGLDAATTEEGVNVTWATASELNNDYFEIERILPNGEVVIIGKMDAAGTADSERNYSILDQNAPQGQLKYRIKQVDFDGGYSYSAFVEVVNVREQSLVYPNPTNGPLLIAIPDGQTERVEVTIRDFSGRTVLTSVSQGESILELSIEGQPAGWYLAETLSSTGVRTETRVLKVN